MALRATLEQPRPSGDDLGMRFGSNFGGAIGWVGALIVLAACEAGAPPQVGSQPTIDPERPAKRHARLGFETTSTSVVYTQEHVELTRYLPMDAVGELRDILVARSKAQLQTIAETVPKVELRTGVLEPQRFRSSWMGEGGRPFEVWRVGFSDAEQVFQPVDTLIWHAPSKRALGWSDIFRQEALSAIQRAVCRREPSNRACDRLASLNLRLHASGCEKRGYKVHRIEAGTAGHDGAPPLAYSGDVLAGMVRQEFRSEFGVVQGCPPGVVLRPVNAPEVQARPLNPDELRLLIYGVRLAFHNGGPLMRPDSYFADGMFVSGAPDQDLTEGRFRVEGEDVCVERLKSLSCRRLFVDREGKYYLRYPDGQKPGSVVRVVALER